MDEDLSYDARELDKRVVAKDQIRTIVRAVRDNLPAMFPDRNVDEHGRLEHIPKTLIFAKDDSHAEDIVRIVREEFGKDNDAIAKITCKSCDGRKPEDLLSELRTGYNPRIAVTVDVIATGADVKPLEMVVFMRMVRSRDFFEQMKGRGVRTIPDDDLQIVTPDAVHKDRFVLVDAVGVTETYSKPYAQRLTYRDIKDLAEAIARPTAGPPSASGRPTRPSMPPRSAVPPARCSPTSSPSCASPSAPTTSWPPSPTRSTSASRPDSSSRPPAAASSPPTSRSGSASSATTSPPPSRSRPES